MQSAYTSKVPLTSLLAAACLLSVACGGDELPDGPASREARLAPLQLRLATRAAEDVMQPSIVATRRAEPMPEAPTAATPATAALPVEAPSRAPAPEAAPAPDGSSLWSDPATWGSTPPVAGGVVVVPAGRVITLDVSPPALTGLRIEGTLRFARQDLALNAGYIEVTGALQIGTASQPFAQRATITLTAAEPAAADNGRARGLVVRGGRLELFGAVPRPVWTKLNEHADAGATALSLKDSVSGWKAGDMVAVAPTDFFGVATTERLTLNGADRTHLTLSTPLTKFRWGKLQYVTNNGMSLTPDPTFIPPAAPAPTELDERAAVANLTRNIVIQGADDASWRDRGFGAHVMVVGLASKVTVDGVEIRRAGQAGRVDRYPFHWNRLSYDPQGMLIGDAIGHVLRNSSIWSSSQRCVVIQATNGVQVLNNICQDIKGHAFALLEGAERRNVFEGNLALLMRSPVKSQLLQLHEGPEVFQGGPSGFFVTNPDNVLRTNHGGDSVGPGFWLSFGGKPVGGSASVSIIPDRLPFGVFEGNTSHSSMAAGITLAWSVIDSLGNVGVRQYTPTADGTEAGQRRRFTLKRATAFKNMHGALANIVSLPDYEEFVTADNVGTYFQGKVDDGNISRGLAVGYSLNSLTPLPKSWHSTSPVAFATYHSMANMHHNTAVAFPFVDKQASGVFSTIDYYITAVDKGTVRNPGNRLIQSHPGYRVLPPSLDPTTAAGILNTLSGAIWDPHGYWGPAGRFWVYDIPFLTAGANCQWVAPAGLNGKTCDGEFYGIGGFQTDFAPGRYTFKAPIAVDRQQPGTGAPLGTYAVGVNGTESAGFRHFAARPGGQYLLRFPGNAPAKWVRMDVMNAYRGTDSFVIGVPFDPSLTPSGYTVAGPFRDRNPSIFAAGQPEAKYARSFIPAASLEEVHASQGDRMWQDKANSLLWIKYRGGLPYPLQPAPNSDDDLYRGNSILITGQ